jgi:hypothetical protein
MSAGLVDSNFPRAAQATAGRVLFVLDARATLEQHQPMARVLDAAGWESWFMPLAGCDLGADAAPLRLWPLTPAVPAKGARAPSGKPAARRPSRLRFWAGRLLRAGGMSMAREFVFAAQMSRDWHRKRALAGQRIAALDPRCIVTAQDRLQDALPVVAAAKELGIPVILAASAGLYMPDGCAYLRKDNPAVRLDRGLGTAFSTLLLNRFVGWLQPAQVFSSRWGRMLYQPAGWHFAAWLTGLGLPSFWYQGARFAAAVIVSGDDERRVCESAGIPPSRVFPIGSPALQLQYERRRDRERLRGELGVARIESLIIVALPQFWEHGMMDKATHFAFVDRFFSVLAECKANVVISLHPKMNRMDYLSRIRAAGLRIADRPLIEILAAADLFIAGAYSTTMRWAMAIGIPSMNLDLWELNESTYKDVSEYPTVRSWDEALRWLDMRLGEGRKVRIDAVPPMGLICDGRFPERFVALVEHVARDRRR